MRAAPSDQIRELMGAANLSSTADLKAAKKAAKANYAAELQAQMRANEEAKLRERMERLGIARPPPLQAPPQGGLPDGGASVSPGAQGPGMMGLGHVSPPRAAPPPYQSAGPQIGPPSAFSVPGPGPALGLPPTGSPGGGAAPSSIWSQPPPYQPNPNPFQPPMPPQYLPAGPLGNLYGMPPPNPSPPPPFGSANGYGSQPPSFNGPPLPNFGPNGISGYGPPPGGGYAPPAPPPPPPLLPGPAPPPGPGRDTMHRLEQQAKKDQYRLELEAQIREREERKVAEKARQREEDMRKEAEMAIGAREAMGRGGGGAPLRDAAGNVVANLRGVGVMGGGMGGMGPSQGFPGPGAMGMGPPGGMGMGPPGGMGMGHMMPPPPPPLVGSPPGIGMGMGMGMGEALMNGASGGAMMNGPPPLLPVMGGPPMMGSPQGMGPPLGMMGGLGGGPSQMEGGQPGVLPNFRFRSDNAYLTPKELDNKQRQMRELQEALEQQIQEKRRAKELEKHKEMAEIEREEARFRAGLEQQRGGGQDGGAGDGAGRSKEEVLADAWEKARLEAEELRRNKFAAKRGTGPVSRGPGAGSASPVPGDRSGGPWGEGAGGGPEIPHQLHSQPSAPQVQGGGGFGDVYPPPQLMTGAPMAVGRPSTPLVVEKVRQVAAAELAAVKQELAAEAAQLREVVAAQGQQVAALKSHAERMEAEAGRAREQVAAMRLGLVQQRGTAAPAGGGPAYDFDNQLVAVPPPPPPALADIDLDLPPTGAMLRRSAAPPPAYDMGPAIPAVNNSLLMVENAAASSINSSVAFAANGGAVAMNGRPPSRLRAVNPLEASMAGESVFIYPNGREMARHANGGPSSQAPSPTGPLPFQSIHVANRMGAGAAAIPTVVTTQELETGPLPLTPQSAAPASSVVSGLGLANSVIAVPTASIDAPAPEPMATGSLSASVVGSCVSEHQPALPDSRQAAALPTTLDVDIVMNRNKEKLEMLKGITDLTTGAASVEALDAFLARYAAQRPGLPERTATPVLRVCTPSLESTGAPPQPPVEHTLLRNSSLPAATPLYSSRANSVGPLPMGGGRVLQAGGRSTAGSGSVSSTVAGGEGSITLEGGGGGDGAHSAGTNGTIGMRAGSIGGSSIDGGSVGAISVGEVSGCGANLGNTLGSTVGSTLGNGGITGSGRLVASPPSRLGTGRVSRRNSFTGGRTPQEGVLSQLLEPVPRPKTGPEPGGAGGVRAPSPMAGRPPMLPNTRYSNSGGSRGGTGVPPSGYVPSCASRPTSGATPAALPPSRPTRSVTRGSDDGSFNATSAWPSYNPSRQSSTGAARLSRSRSLSTNGESHQGAEPATASAPQRDSVKGPERPEVLSPPPEDTLDVEMRKGLGTAAAAPPTPPSVGHQGSLPGTPARGSSRQTSVESGIPAFQIPRSPMLAGARRTGSAASQRGS